MLQGDDIVAPSENVAALAATEWLLQGRGTTDLKGFHPAAALDRLRSCLRLAHLTPAFASLAAAAAEFEWLRPALPPAAAVGEPSAEGVPARADAALAAEPRATVVRLLRVVPMLRLWARCVIYFAILGPH